MKYTHVYDPNFWLIIMIRKRVILIILQIRRNHKTQHEHISYFIININNNIKIKNKKRIIRIYKRQTQKHYKKYII